MIPTPHINAWSKSAPWADPKQVEQDLIISRAIVEIFSSPLLRNELRFIGGTALHKLYFPEPMRYSEDVDLLRTARGPTKEMVKELRRVLEFWLGKAAFKQTGLGPKLIFRFPQEGTGSQLRLKVEINTWHKKGFSSPEEIPFSVRNPWFSGDANVATYSREDLLAGKLVALYGRDKSRDLYDLAMGLEKFADLDCDRIVGVFRQYLGQEQPSRAEFQKNLLEKFSAKQHLEDWGKLLSSDLAGELTEQTALKYLHNVLESFIDRLPGKPWKLYDEKKREIGLP